MPGTLTVTPAVLTVTANDTNRFYGAENPLFTMRYSGFVGDDNPRSLTTVPVATAPAAPGDWIGAYTITPANGVSPNYTFNYVNGTLTVDKAPLIVIGNNASRGYGAPDPSFSATMIGLVNKDDITYTLSSTAAPTSGPGIYEIQLDLNDPTGRLGLYDLTLVGGLLTIDKASVIGTVQSESRIYGQDNPSFSVSYSSFANGDTASVLSGFLSYACVNGPVAVDRTTGVGSYPIHVTAGQTSPNYTVTYVDGTLAVNPADLTVTAQGATRLYGAANPGFSVNITGFANSDTGAMLGGTLGFSTPAVAGSGVGSYAITPSGLTSANYTIHFVNGSLSVTRAPLTGQVADQTRAYGQTNDTFAVPIAGLSITTARAS